MNPVQNRRLSIALQVVVVILVLSLFLFLISRYIPEPKVIKENPRFVNVDYEQLKQEADSIVISNSSKGNADNVFVLTYHVITKGEPKDDYDISYEQFKANMFALKSQGYQTVSLDELYLFMNGEKDLPDKSFVLTFDDAAKGGYYNADPILKALNYTAVIFVITEQSLEEKQGPYYLNETELIAAQQTGRWEMGAHTHESHYRLPINAQGSLAPALTNKLWIPAENRVETNQEFYTRVSTDLAKSNYLLETKFNKSATSFALPYGDFGERGSNYANAHEIIYNLTTSMYKLVFYEFPIKDKLFRANYQESSQKSHLIVRIPADSLRTPEELMQIIEASRQLKLPYSEDYNNQNRWIRISGEASFEKDRIILKSEEDSLKDNKFAYLDGSNLWKDYHYFIQLKDFRASTVVLLSRLTSSADYTACQYSKGFVRIINVKEGVQTTIKEAALSENLTYGTSLSMSVSGLNAKCLMNGKEVLSAEVPDIPAHGGVGVKAEGFETIDKTFAFGKITVIKK